MKVKVVFYVLFNLIIILCEEQTIRANIVSLRRKRKNGKERKEGERGRKERGYVGTRESCLLSSSYNQILVLILTTVPNTS